MQINKISVYDFDPSSARERKIYSGLTEHLEYASTRLNNDWVGIFLAGSQNYGIDTSESDIDTYLLVLPTLDDIIQHKEMISMTLTTPSGEKCSVKDIRLMFSMFKKQSINSLEILFTKWKFLNPMYEESMSMLFRNAEMIAQYDNHKFASSLWGMMCNEFLRVSKDTPANHERISQYGYDGKALAHMDRLHEFFVRFFLNEEPFADCLVSKKKTLLLAAKSHCYTLDCANVTANTLFEETRDMVGKYKEDHPRIHNDGVDVFLNAVAEGIMLCHIENELRKRRNNES